MRVATGQLPYLVQQVLAQAAQFRAAGVVVHHDTIQDDLVRVVLQILPEDLTLLAQHLPQGLSWLLLYHPETPASLLPWALTGLPHQSLVPRYELRATIDPAVLDVIDSSVRPLVVGRLMLAALNGQLPLSALPRVEHIHRYLDAWAYGCLLGRHAALWDALYAIAEAVELWQETGFHPRQWECQTITGSLPSAEGAGLLAYAATMWRWAQGNMERQDFVEQWWGLTLRYLGSEVGALHLTLSELCRFMQQALDLAPPFLEAVQPDPEVLHAITVDDFDSLLDPVALCGCIVGDS